MPEMSGGWMRWGAGRCAVSQHHGSPSSPHWALSLCGQGLCAPVAGSRDAEDLADIHASGNVAPLQGQRGAYHDAEGDVAGAVRGAFEDYTKGIGGRVLRAQGWRDGEGLGVPGRKGEPNPVAAEGQLPWARYGLGYYGERLDREATRRPKEAPLIGSIFDRKLPRSGGVGGD